MADYEWGDKLACVATYTVLEGDRFLDQFEDAEIPFDEAGKLKIGKLRFYPHTTNNPNILEMLSLGVARAFLKDVTKTYSSRKEDPAMKSATLIRDTAKIFEDEEKTLTDLAAVVDKFIRFQDEA
jgi:hypothetical protein